MTDIFNESSRLLFGIELVAEETIQAEASDDGLPIMDWAYVWCPRFTGLMMAIASLVVMKMAWKRQHLVFHRLILGKKVVKKTRSFAVALRWRTSLLVCVANHWSLTLVLLFTERLALYRLQECPFINYYMECHLSSEIGPFQGTWTDISEASGIGEHVPPRAFLFTFVPGVH